MGQPPTPLPRLNRHVSYLRKLDLPLSPSEPSGCLATPSKFWWSFSCISLRRLFCSWAWMWTLGRFPYAYLLFFTQHITSIHGVALKEEEWQNFRNERTMFATKSWRRTRYIAWYLLLFRTCIKSQINDDHRIYWIENLYSSSKEIFSFEGQPLLFHTLSFTLIKILYNNHSFKKSNSNYIFT